MTGQVVSIWIKRAQAVAGRGLAGSADQRRSRQIVASGLIRAGDAAELT